MFEYQDTIEEGQYLTECMFCKEQYIIDRKSWQSIRDSGQKDIDLRCINCGLYTNIEFYEDMCVTTIMLYAYLLNLLKKNIRITINELNKIDKERRRKFNEE